MKAPRSSSSGRSAVWLAAISCAVVGVIHADVGGGHGKPATPWSFQGPKSVEELEKARAAADQVQQLWLPGKLTNEKVQLDDVALQSLPSREGEKGAYQFTGKDESGKDVSLTFSTIESFVVKAKTDRSITLSVTVWPDISLQDLLAKQPTYTDISKSYRRDVSIEIPLRTSDGREHGFAPRYGESQPLSKLELGTKGDFYGGNPHSVNPRRFWWAIPSVTADPTYPFRMMPRARSDAGAEAREHRMSPAKESKENRVHA
jgi:hypothetical protein